MKLCDFHTHTFYSDGVFAPVELIRRASVAGYSVIGIADHTGSGGVERLVQEIAEDCAVASEHWDIEAFVGVELTHVPPAAIAQLTAKARAAGAAFVAANAPPCGTDCSPIRAPATRPSGPRRDAAPNRPMNQTHRKGSHNI